MKTGHALVRQIAEDRIGRRVVYTWTNNRLTKVTDVLGHEWKYVYNNDGQITKLTGAITLELQIRPRRIEVPPAIGPGAIHAHATAQHLDT
jgi:YD repeat-containing protein